MESRLERKKSRDELFRSGDDSVANAYKNFAYSIACKQRQTLRYTLQNFWYLNSAFDDRTLWNINSKGTFRFVWISDTFLISICDIHSGRIFKVISKCRLYNNFPNTQHVMASRNARKFLLFEFKFRNYQLIDEISNCPLKCRRTALILVTYDGA